jgi:ribosomal protein S18 acetylase RimI-like enzyme
MTAPRITGRSETPQDEPFLRRLIMDTVAAQLGAAAWPADVRETILNLQYQARRQAVRSRFPNGESRIILVDGREAGWLYVAELPEETRLVEIMVLGEYRGQGIGTAVLSQLIATAEEAGKPVRLSVDARNAGAIRLYERAGFRFTGSDEVQRFMERATA